MFSQWFVHPWLLAGLGLIAAPVLIHLLHRLRFRRVRWGPMEFLLQSRRRRRRLMLEHLLLLLLRCAFTAIAVLIVARPETAGALEGLLAGGERPEHVVVLDDTMSMGQSRGSESAFDAAKAAVARAVGRWAERPGERTLTLLRTSAPTPPDVAGASVDEALSARMERLFAGLAPSYLACSPAEAVRCAERMLGESSAAKRRLHVFSDFQRKDWGPQSEVYAVLRRLGSKGASIQLIDASGDPPPNLAVVEASARGGTVAAGSAFRVEAVVRNFSSSNTGPTVASASLDGRPLPACAVGGLAAGESASASFDAASAAPGVHEIAFEIPVDGLAADNRRTLVVEAQQEAPVLIVDGGAERRDSLFLSLALAPGGGVDTGLAPRVRSVEALRQDDLSSYRAVYLVDVPEVDSAASARLLEYVQGGGGVGVFLGGGVDPARYNAELFRGGGGSLAGAARRGENAVESFRGRGRRLPAGGPPRLPRLLRREKLVFADDLHSNVLRDRRKEPRSRESSDRAPSERGPARRRADVGEGASGPLSHDRGRRMDVVAAESDLRRRDAAFERSTVGVGETRRRRDRRRAMEGAVRSGGLPILDRRRPARRNAGRPRARDARGGAGGRRGRGDV